MINNADYHHLMILTVIGSSIGLVTGIVRYKTVAPEQESNKAGKWAILGTVFIGTLISWGLDIFIWPLSVKAMVIGVGSFIAMDLLYGIVLLGSQIRINPIGFLQDLWGSFRGGQK